MELYHAYYFFFMYHADSLCREELHQTGVGRIAKSEIGKEAKPIQ